MQDLETNYFIERLDVGFILHAKGLKIAVASGGELKEQVTKQIEVAIENFTLKKHNNIYIRTGISYDVPTVAEPSKKIPQ